MFHSKFQQVTLRFVLVVNAVRLKNEAATDSSNTGAYSGYPQDDSQQLAQQ